MSGLKQGMLWKSFHGLIIVVGATLGKSLMLQGISVFQLLFCQALMGLGIIGVISLATKTPVIYTPKKALNLFRGVIGAVSIPIYYLCIKLLPIPTVTAIGFSAPITTTLMAIFILKEPFSVKQFGWLLLGIAGTLVIIQPGTDSFQLMSLVVLFSTILWSIGDIVIKKLGNSDSGLTHVFYNMLYLCLFLLPFVFQHWTWPTSHTVWLWAGALLTLLPAQYAIFMSYKSFDLSMVIPFRTLQLVFAAIFGYCFFGDRVTLPILVGSAMILASVMMIYRLGNATSTLPSQRQKTQA